MTEYSKGSRNMKAETVSNTGGNSGQAGQTHPYSHHSHSPSHYSENSHSLRSSGVPTEDTFQLPIQYIMPLVGAVKEENEHLKDQRCQVEAEMKTLGRVAKQLLEENQQLRAHHRLRTQDIRRLIDTISLNTNEDLSDLTHQSFLLKESNHALVKKIENHMRANSQAEALLNNTAAELEALHLQGQVDQRAIRDLQVKNKQLFYRCEQLKRQAEDYDCGADSEAVNEALVTVVALRNHNKQNVLRARSLLIEHQTEKPFVQDSHASTAQQNKQLKAEEQQLREAARNSEARLEEVKIAHTRSFEALTESYRNYERARHQLATTEQEIIKVKQAISDSKNNTQKVKSAVEKLKEEKEVLKNKILVKKQAMNKAKLAQMEEEQRQAKELKIQLGKMKEEVIRNTIKANEEISKKIVPEATAIGEGIARSKEEYAELVQQVQELEEAVRKLDNPRKEIIRLQYQLKKLNSNNKS